MMTEMFPCGSYMFGPNRVMAVAVFVVVDPQRKQTEPPQISAGSDTTIRMRGMGRKRAQNNDDAFRQRTYAGGESCEVKDQE